MIKFEQNTESAQFSLQQVIFFLHFRLFDSVLLTYHSHESLPVEFVEVEMIIHISLSWKSIYI